MFELVQTRWKLIIKFSEYVCDCWGQQNKCSSHNVTSVPSSPSVAHCSSFPEHTRGPDFVDPRLPRHLPPSHPLHKYIFYSLLLIYASTQVHLLQPLQEHTFCLLPTLYKSTSSAKAHLLHPRICVVLDRKLWDANQLEILKSNFTRESWGAVTGTTMEFSIRWEIYLLICHKLSKMNFEGLSGY